MIPILRAIGAVALTGIISPLLFSAGYGAFYSFETGVSFSAEPVLFMVFYGTLVTFPLAFMMGIFVEYPKLLWLRRNQGFGRLAQLLVSVVGAWSMSVLFVTITEGTIPRFDQPFEEYFFVASAAAIGGITSGIVWWALVARHMLAATSAAR